MKMMMMMPLFYTTTGMRTYVLVMRGDQEQVVTNRKKCYATLLHSSILFFLLLPRKQRYSGAPNKFVACTPSTSWIVFYLGSNPLLSRVSEWVSELVISRSVGQSVMLNVVIFNFSHTRCTRMNNERKNQSLIKNYWCYNRRWVLFKNNQPRVITINRKRYFYGWKIPV